WFGYRSALRTGEIGVLRATLRLTVVADTWLTAPAVAFQAASGVALVLVFGWPLVSPWSLAVWSLFLVAGVCWLPVLKLQVLLRNEAERASSVTELPATFHLWFRWWFALGVPAFAAVIAIYWLMVAKPLATSG
ncbi:MAG TPA: DUF2269 domain-containing protein, partial [Burkholderiales bacterium]|nr:DUF2269 domain-containing protein [Burkholderiales bacterium]